MHNDTNYSITMKNMRNVSVFVITSYAAIYKTIYCSMGLCLSHGGIFLALPSLPVPSVLSCGVSCPAAPIKSLGAGVGGVGGEVELSVSMGWNRVWGGRALGTPGQILP